MIGLKKDLQDVKNEMNDKNLELENRKKYLKFLKIQDLEVFIFHFS